MMAEYICTKTNGQFRMGGRYSFDTPTAQALSSIRAGYLKPLADGGAVSKPVQVSQSPAPLVVPVAKKRGRPTKVRPVATKDIGGLEDEKVA
jgi:hypothetical protein